MLKKNIRRVFKNIHYITISFIVLLVFGGSLISRAEDTITSNINVPPAADNTPVTEVAVDQPADDTQTIAPADGSATDASAESPDQPAAPEENPPPAADAPPADESQPAEEPIVIQPEELAEEPIVIQPEELAEEPAVIQPEEPKKPVQDPDVKPEPVPVVEPPAPQKYLSFSLGGDSIATQRNLPWFPDRFKTDGNAENPGINAAISGDSSSVILDGSCSKTFFVVLVYADPSDYADNPNAYVYNKAFSCKDGSYHYELNDLPKDLPDGSYYLLVAEEGLTGPWQPITAIQPVIVKSGYK
jgi:hypothetical protein